MKRIRTLIADDSGAVRRILTTALRWDPVFEIIGEARTGREAIALVESLRPDFVTMDIEMPEMDGLTALDQILDRQPTAVAMLTSMDRRFADDLLNALERGAIDYVPKTHLGLREPGPARLQLFSRLKDAVWSFHAQRCAPLAEHPGPGADYATTRPSQDPACLVVVAGQGGGGTIDVQRLLMSLPASFRLPIVVLIPMDEYLAQSFGERCRTLSQLPVDLAESGLELRPGRVAITKGDHSVRFEAGENGRAVCRPQRVETQTGGMLDLSLEKTVSFFGDRALYLVVSGAGIDGLKGLQEVGQSGARLLYQHEETSLVADFSRFCRQQGIGEGSFRTDEIQDLFSTWSGDKASHHA